MEIEEKYKDFCIQKIIQLVNAIKERSNLKENSQDIIDLNWIKFYAKELGPCKNCSKEVGA